MENKPLRIVQISDIHLFADKENALLGVKTFNSFSKVVELLKQEQEQPDLIIVSGDISQDYTQQSYLHLAHFLKGFPIPIYYVPGNHDDRNVMRSIYPRDNISNLRQIILKQTQIILLNSQKAQAVYGWLDNEELFFLKECLEEYPALPAIIVFHHQPIPVGCAWLDDLGLKNADSLWELLRNYSNKMIILFGHIHQEHSGKKNEIQYYSAPSTCIQFKRNSEAFALENLNPGYRWLEMNEAGDINTGITRIDQYVGVFDQNAKGY